jgi:hypothetical protein
MPSYPQVQFQPMDPFGGQKQGINALAVAAQINETSRRTDLMANEDQRRQEMWAEEKELAPVKRIQAVTGVMSQFLPRMSQDQYSGWRQESIKRGIPEAMLPSEDTVKGLTPQEWETKKNEWAMAGAGFQQLKTAEALAKIQVDTHRQNAEFASKKAKEVADIEVGAYRDKAKISNDYANALLKAKTDALGMGSGSKHDEALFKAKATEWKSLQDKRRELALKVAGEIMPDAKNEGKSQLAALDAQLADIANLFDKNGWDLDALAGGEAQKYVKQASTGYDFNKFRPQAVNAQPSGTPNVTTAGPPPAAPVSTPPQNAIAPEEGTPLSAFPQEQQNYLQREQDIYREDRRAKAEKNWSKASQRQNALDERAKRRQAAFY